MAILLLHFLIHNLTQITNILLKLNQIQAGKWTYWSSTNHTFNPETTNENVITVVNSSDTIVLHLNQQSYSLTYVVEPDNAQIDIEINGNNKYISIFNN